MKIEGSLLTRATRRSNCFCDHDNSDARDCYESSDARDCYESSDARGIYLKTVMQGSVMR